MSQFPSDFLKDIVQQASVITAGAAEVQLGPDIPEGHVRRITRIHVPGDPTPATRSVDLFRGSTNTPAATFIDNFTVISGNPDFEESTDDLQAPLMTIRQVTLGAGTPPPVLPDADVENKLFIRRVGAVDARMTISFYDELA